MVLYDFSSIFIHLFVLPVHGYVLTHIYRANLSIFDISTNFPLFLVYGYILLLQSRTPILSVFDISIKRTSLIPVIPIKG